MSVRRTIGRTASQEVTKTIGDRLITIYRRDTFRQTKSHIYAAFKKIESGQLTIDPRFNIFHVELDGSLTGYANV